MPRGAPAGDAVPARKQDAVLLTTSCTRGWTDWVHGQLWLCTDGLLRLSLGLAATIAKESSPQSSAAFEGIARQAGRRQFEMTEITELLSEKRSNVWVPWVEIREAALRNGLINTGRLRLTLADGRSVKLLWKRDRQVFGVLRDKLLERVGPVGLRLG